MRCAVQVPLRPRLLRAHVRVRPGDQRRPCQRLLRADRPLQQPGHLLQGHPGAARLERHQPSLPGGPVPAPELRQPQHRQRQLRQLRQCVPDAHDVHGRGLRGAARFLRQHHQGEGRAPAGRGKRGPQECLVRGHLFKPCGGEAYFLPSALPLLPSPNFPRWCALNAGGAVPCGHLLPSSQLHARPAAHAVPCKPDDLGRDGLCQHGGVRPAQPLRADGHVLPSQRRVLGVRTPAGLPYARLLRAAVLRVLLAPPPHWVAAKSLE